MGLLAELRGNSCVESKLSTADACAHSTLTTVDACAQSPVYSSIQRGPLTSPKTGLCLSSFQDDHYTKLLGKFKPGFCHSIKMTVITKKRYYHIAKTVKLCFFNNS